MTPIVNNVLKPIRAHFRSDVKEFIMNKPMEVMLETTQGKWEFKKDSKLDYDWFTSMATVMATTTGQQFSESTSILSFKLPEGHRVQIVHGETTKDHFLLSIRLFRGVIFSLDDYQIEKNQKEKIIEAVINKENLLISGGTGTGKTSFLNCIINNYVEKEARIVTIEGVSELIIKHHKNVAHLYYLENQNHSKGVKINKASDLLNASLRIRPDRIIMGELRQENCFTFVRAINTGHSGSMATIHANTPENALSAIKENVILSGEAAEGSINILDQQLKRNIFGVIQLERIAGGKVKGYFEQLAT